MSSWFTANITALLCCVEWTVHCMPDSDTVVNKLWCQSQQRQQVSNVIAFYNAKLWFTLVLKRSLSAHWMQVKLFLSLLIWTAYCTQFLSENQLHGCQILGWFGFFIYKSEANFGFPHTLVSNIVGKTIECSIVLIWQDMTSKKQKQKRSKIAAPCPLSPLRPRRFIGALVLSTFGPRVVQAWASPPPSWGSAPPATEQRWRS